VERLANEFGYDATSSKLGSQYVADSNPRTLLGRVENELKSDAHARQRESAAKEKARLEEWNESRKLTPEQVAENKRRIAELQRQWFDPKEAA
jgi:hypothetical protein